jgi:RNA recognition motif-containing protein
LEQQFSFLRWNKPGLSSKYIPLEDNGQTSLLIKFPRHKAGFGAGFQKKGSVPERNKVDLGSYKQHMKLFVAGLPYDFDDTDLKEMFELYGQVSSAKVAIDRETRKSRGFGFLEMTVALEAKEAIDALHGARLRGGKELVVREAEEKPRDNNNNSYRPRR